MLQKTAQYIRQHKMLLPGERVVLGMSGGADSVCLFHVLKDLKVPLEVVHVNHGIRDDEARRDERFAEELCRRYDIPFHSYFFDVPAISRENHWSEEEAGRRVRRQAFAEVMKNCGASHIALAHHGNDRAETFLFHLCRGTGLKGLSAMRPVDGCYIRPFLWAERKEIEAYAQAQGYQFVEDSTNAWDCYTRNKLRHRVIPVLEEINKKSVAHISGASEKLCTVFAYMEREAGKLFEKSVVVSEKEVSIRKKPFFEGDSVLHTLVLQKCVECLRGSLSNMTEEHWKLLLRLFDLQTGKEADLPAGLAAARTYEGIRLFFREAQYVPEPVKIEGSGTYLFSGNVFLVTVEEWNEKKIFPANHYTKCFDYDKIIGSLFLRTRKKGDYLEINKNHGKKSLQDYLVNEKVSREKREDVILLAEGSHILWVTGKRISEYYKITEQTKRVLRVQMNGGHDAEF